MTAANVAAADMWRMSSQFDDFSDEPFLCSATQAFQGFATTGMGSGCVTIMTVSH
jgi:hypothetical protein